MRIFSAFSYFFKILFKGEASVLDARIAVLKASQSTETSNEAPRPEFTVSSAPAVQVLNLLQKNGRLIDFLQEDISQFDDADVGAAVRDIHSGCRKVLDKHFALKPVIEQNEGDTVDVAAEFDPSRIELVGNLIKDDTKQTGLKGTLIHRGWVATQTQLPTIAAGQDESIVAPAQVEV
ncbi:DUF2760 domain-containing protein [Algibacillus agarilyticus]|uniref:DUF2760 domain-containing protein n=1 Tax=Algibacillus agarilyticus TaxID=2234133 RepID=UPI000DD07D03|nr:DUF2760 domain-containing protein [Algibacillus agarilyticus]